MTKATPSNGELPATVWKGITKTIQELRKRDKKHSNRHWKNTMPNFNRKRI